MKSIIIDEISELIINHENKLNNSSKLEELLANKIIHELINQYPDIMTPIIESNIKIKVGVTLACDEYYDKYRQNIIDKNYISVPVLEYSKTNNENKYIELTPYEILELNIKEMIYPIILRNYSLVKRLEFLEYSVARIDDYEFYKNISNLVYLKDSLSNPYIDKLFSLGTIIGSTSFIKEISKVYRYSTKSTLEKDFKESNIYKDINNIILNVIKENTTYLRNSTLGIERKVYKIFEKFFNLKRKFINLEPVDFDIETIDNYSFLLSTILDEMEYLKTLRTYYSNGYVKSSDYKDVNGFYKDNGDFIMLSSLGDSLIEKIKTNIKYKKYYDLDGRLISVAAPFNDYGFNYTLVCHESYTTLIYNSCFDFISKQKEKIANAVVKAYKQKKKSNII